LSVRRPRIIGRHRTRCGALDVSSSQGSTGGDAGSGDSGIDAGSGCVASLAFTETCTDFTSCGGDPTGSWIVVGGCMGGAAVPSCTQVTESGSVCVVKGTADFSGASGSIELYASYNSLTIAYPTSCSCTATLQNPALDLYEGS
jgi:hypothetical protein